MNENLTAILTAIGATTIIYLTMKLLIRIITTNVIHELKERGKIK